MTSDIVCIHQGEDGTVCASDLGDAYPYHHEPVGPECVAMGCHPMTPGRECPTCKGSVAVAPFGGFATASCHTCADSPVRGYQKL